MESFPPSSLPAEKCLLKALDSDVEGRVRCGVREPDTLEALIEDKDIKYQYLALYCF
jgi:hypothetical protein